MKSLQDQIDDINKRLDRHDLLLLKKPLKKKIINKKQAFEEFKKLYEDESVLINNIQAAHILSVSRRTITNWKTRIEKEREENLRTPFPSKKNANA